MCGTLAKANESGQGLEKWPGMIEVAKGIRSSKR